jgi:hypothetical protein
VLEVIRHVTGASRPPARLQQPLSGQRLARFDQVSGEAGTKVILQPGRTGPEVHPGGQLA